MRCLDPMTIAMALLVAACGDGASPTRPGDGGGGSGGSAPEVPSQPEGWDADVRLAPAVDLNPDPHVLEVAITARVADVEVIPGRITPAWTYDGRLPGPLLELTAGDRLVVHFRNELPVDTTIHWHGLRIGADQDGAPHEGQPPVPPGGTFEYSFIVPDAGLYWYHPHVDSAAQVGYGLYGAILVHPSPDAPPEPATLGDTLTLVISDIGIEEDGALRDPEAGGDLGMLFGREGATVLVNGRVLPEVRARAGSRQRWRIVNTARSRYLELDLPGHRFTRIGGDGGLLPAPLVEERLHLVPGQRVDAVVTLEGEPGDTLPLRWIPVDRGYGTADFRDPEDILTVRFDGGPRGEAPPMPQISRTIEPPDPHGANPIDIALTQTSGPDGVELGINGEPWWSSEPIEARVDERQLWTVTNDMDWDHPFHLHGFFFHEVDEAGELVQPLELRDTLNVPRHASRRFVVRWEHRPGMWMFHCHILDHAEAGMMGMVHLH